MVWDKLLKLRIDDPHVINIFCFAAYMRSPCHTELETGASEVRSKFTFKQLAARRTPDDINDTWASHLVFKEGKFKLMERMSINRYDLGATIVVSDQMVAAPWKRYYKPATITSSSDMVGLESTISVLVRDLWQHKDVTHNASVSF
ncbi:hypothetical protein YC2023_052397 [Brassica napus]